MNYFHRVFLNNRAYSLMEMLAVVAIVSVVTAVSIGTIAFKDDDTNVITASSYLKPFILNINAKFLRQKIYETSATDFTGIQNGLDGYCIIVFSKIPIATSDGDDYPMIVKNIETSFNEEDPDSSGIYKTYEIRIRNNVYYSSTNKLETDDCHISGDEFIHASDTNSDGILDSENGRTNIKDCKIYEATNASAKSYIILALNKRDKNLNGGMNSIRTSFKIENSLPDGTNLCGELK